MLSRTIKSLYLGKEGNRSVHLLFIQALLIGIFMGSLEISAQTLFLESYNTAKLPLAIFLSGGTGIIFMIGYFQAKKRLNTRILGILNLLFISLLTGSVTILYLTVNKPVFLFIALVLMFPLIFLVSKGLIDTISGSFRSLHISRLENLMISAKVIGIILIALLIPLLINLGFQIQNAFTISSISITGAFLLQLYQNPVSKYSPQEAKDEDERIEAEKLTFQDIVVRRYTSLIIGFLALSIITFVFIFYSFLALSETKFEDSSSLASFLGFYLTGFILLSIFLERVIYPNMIKKFGLRLLLLSSPLVLLFLAGIMDLIWANNGMNTNLTGFGVVFVFMVLAMLFSRSFREAIENPVIRILLQPLQLSERKQFFEIIQKNIREPVIMLSGLILMVLTIAGFSLLQINYLLVLLVAAWIYLAFLIYNNYRTTLQDSLKSIRKPVIKKVKKEKSIYDRVKQDKSVVRVKWLLEFAPQSWNGYLTENLQTLLRTNNAEVMELTLDWIERLNIAESRNALLYAEQHMEDRKRNRVRILIDRYNHITPPPDRALVESKMSSIKWEDRLFALTALLKKPELLKHGILNPLLKDNDFQVRISAIRLIGVYKLTEYTQELLELLDDDRFYAFAWNSLHKMSSEILSSLDKVFNKPDVSRRKLERVIRLIALSESDERINYLVGKLNRSEDFILRYTLKSLAESDFRPYEQTRIRLKEILFKYTGMAAWNMSVLESCQFNKLNPELVKAMDLEYKQAYQVIFYTLSVLHGRSAIGEIQRNIESGIAESIGYSIELMDLFIDEDIKEWLFVFFEAGRKTNRIKKLQMSFPVSLLRGEALLHAIINRDYNYINTFTRVLAIKELEKLKNYTVGETLIAQLFNPDDIVAESSVQQVIKHDPDILADVIPRLPDKRREQIISILERKTTRRFGDSLETYRYLKKCLHNSDELNDFTLFKLSMDFQTFQLKAGGSLELVEIYGESEFILGGTADFTASSGNVEIGSYDKDELKLVKVKTDSPEKNLVIKSTKNLKLIVLPLSSLQELIFDNEEEFFALLPAMFEKPKVKAE